MDSDAARAAYGRNAAPALPPRAVEYKVFAQITARLSAASGQDDFPQLAAALHDNLTLWTRLATDAASDGNALSPELRAGVVSLAGFARRHTEAVLAGRASAAALIDVNTAVMRGLRGGAEAAA